MISFEQIKPAIPIHAKVIAIAGVHRMGKSTLAREFVGWDIIHTDDYISQFKHEDRAERLIMLCMTHPRYIVEGCEVGRMLRKGEQTGIWHPDFIIWRQPEEKLKGYAKGLQTIFTQYLQIRTHNVPVLFSP